MSEIVKAETAAVAAVAPAQTLEQFLIRAASDPTFDVDKLERLIALKERMDAAQREKAFFESLALAQAEMPQIDQNGLIDYGAGKGKIPYAKLEDIDAIIRPLYSPYGFSVSWNSSSVMDGKMVRVEGTFAAHGHKETREMTAPIDTSGGKNGTQGVASTIAYGKRQITKMFWNLIERGKDVDGARLKDLQPITQEQADTINTRLQDCRADIDAFKRIFKVEKLADLKAGQLSEVWKQIERKEAQQRAKEGL